MSKRSQVKPSVSKTSARKVQVYSKADSRFWLQAGKLKKWPGSANYSIQLQYKGQRHSFSTGTGNKDAAARTAAGIYTDLLALGVDATLRKHRPEKESMERIATVGEWISGAAHYSEAEPATFNAYAQCLRQIAAGIAKVAKSESRFNPKKGSAQYRTSVDAVSLEIITHTALTEWRKAYIDKATNPLDKKKKQTSCNTTVRQAKALFTPYTRISLKHLILPNPAPFEIPLEMAALAGRSGRRRKRTHPLYFETHSAKYKSKIDPGKLVGAAKEELVGTKDQCFLAFIIAIGAGLRKGEIDALLWENVDLSRRRIRVETTEDGRTKADSSEAEVEIDEATAKILNGYKEKAKTRFVLDGVAIGKRSTTRRQYRAETTFQLLNGWLKLQGIKASKPIHELRKEFGALMTQQHGIYAAKEALRHSAVTTTESHYADLKEKPTISFKAWLNPSVDGEVVGNAPLVTSKKPFSRRRPAA